MLKAALRYLRGRAALIVGIVLALFVGTYGWQADRRGHAQFMETFTAPNGIYRIDKYLLGRGAEATHLYRVYGADQTRVGEYTRQYLGGNYRPQWDCDATTCSEFRWDTHEGDRIALPPTVLDRLHAQLP